MLPIIPLSSITFTAAASEHRHNRTKTLLSKWTINECQCARKRSFVGAQTKGFKDIDTGDSNGDRIS